MPPGIYLGFWGVALLVVIILGAAIVYELHAIHVALTKGV
jgi:hypothetical protein